MKATEQYFHVALFNVLHKVVLAVHSVDGTLVFGHSNAIEHNYATALCSIQVIANCGNVRGLGRISYSD